MKISTPKLFSLFKCFTEWKVKDIVKTVHFFLLLQQRKQQKKGGKERKKNLDGGMVIIQRKIVCTQ